jgi:uncharacterized protein (TIGR04222 family)
MNPFEFRGPEFLFFYAVLTVIVMIVSVTLRKMFDGEASAALQSPSTLVSDPYLIAHLRGSHEETLRVALMSLVDRGLIVDRDGMLTTRDNVKPEHGRRELEREVLRAYTGGADVKTLLKLKKATREYDEQLQRLGLIPDAAVRGRRTLLYVVMMGLLGGMAATKIFIGLTRGRPVGFLVILGVVSLLMLHGLIWRWRTVHGDRFLASVQGLFRGLRDRADSIKRGGGTADLALLAAAFGVMAVPTTAFPYRNLLYPAPVESSSSSSDTSSCGSSSCGGGGGCGGGGCGGCGS